MDLNQNEKKLIETEILLRESESRLKGIAALTSDAIIITDESQRINFFNKRAEQIFGFNSREVIGQSLDLLLPPRFIEIHRRHIQDFKTEPESSRLMGKRMGKIFGRHKNGTEFPVEVSISKWQSEKKIVFAAILRDISERVLTEETIHRLAYFDSLSDLPNRLHFMERLQKAIQEAKEKNQTLAIFLLDLYRFKEINDSLGPLYGDLLIKSFAKRLTEIVDDQHFVARLGGDEFGIIMTTNANQANSLASEIVEDMKRTFTIEKLPLAVEAAIGIALYPNHGKTADSLIQKADIAMYESKNVGIEYSFYNPKIDPFSPNRLTLLGELFEAIESNQLFLLHQPKVDLQSGKIDGVESLVRWQHPSRGVILPNEFISQAENTELIKTVALYVLKEALKQFQTVFNLGKNLTVGINISNRNLHDPLLPGQIVKMLLANKIPPESLELEITENAIMNHSDHALNAIYLIHKTGINLTIDGFGEGYSSLSILKKLPIRSIKIPRSFIKELVTNKDNLKIVQSTINLAHTLGLKVTAVGVENKETLKKLIELGCDGAQGNYLSPPVPIKEIFSMLFKPLDHWI